MLKLKKTKLPRFRVQKGKKNYDCVYYFPLRRSDVVLEEKPESSLVKNVSIASQITKDEQQPGSGADTPPQG